MTCPECAFETADWTEFAIHVQPHGLTYVPPGPDHPDGVLIPGWKYLTRGEGRKALGA